VKESPHHVAPLQSLPPALATSQYIQLCEGHVCSYVGMGRKKEEEEKGEEDE